MWENVLQYKTAIWNKWISHDTKKFDSDFIYFLI